MTFAGESIKAAMRRHKICVLIPTYNNASTLRGVVEETLRYALDVFVVNDGSTDSTSEILEDFHGVITVLTNEKNRGKGHALKRGFKEALEKGFEYAITLDSDGQHNPGEIASFVKAIAENKETLIIGERNLKGKEINSKSAFANKFSNFWFAVHTLRCLKDTQTGYRAYPLKLLPSFSLLSNRYETELELLVLGVWKGLPLRTIPIDVAYPPKNERVSHFRPGCDFARISVVNTIFTFCAFFYGYPRMIMEKIRKKDFFRNEFRPFTRKNGERREAAVTIGRILRSLHALSIFLFWTYIIFKPYLFFAFRLKKGNDKSRRRLRRMMHRRCVRFGNSYPGGKLKIENPHNEDFSKPAVIISNHQSHLDLPDIMALSPNIIFLTNAHVWNNPLLGPMVRESESLPIDLGIDEILIRLGELRDKGLSIMVFPEGTRSADCKIKRFKQGAFALAEALHMDILPLVLHGPGHYLQKGDTLVRKNPQTLRVLPRVGWEQTKEELQYKRASEFRRIIQTNYDAIAIGKKPEYYASMVFYKFAYTGWRGVSRCKKELKKLKEYSSKISDLEGEVWFVNQGVGFIPLLCAFANSKAVVNCIMEDLSDYRRLEAMEGLPSNFVLHHTIAEEKLKNLNQIQI